MTFLSLFSGIGGLDLGLSRAGMRCIGQVEIDPFCRAVLAKHWPDVPRFEDVRTFEAGMLDEKPDLIAGGFPCQDISNAGRRLGINAERSGLWSEFVRIYRAIRPRFILVENVRALLVRGFDRVLWDLAESGYDAEWNCIPAAALGAPHIRDRLFIVAYPDAANLSIKLRPSKKKRSWRPPSIRSPRIFPYSHRHEHKGNPLAYRRETTSQLLAGAGFGRHGPPEGEICARRDSTEYGDWWATEPDVGRVAHGIPARVDRLKGLGNAVVPQVAEFIGRLILATAPRPSLKPEDRHINTPAFAASVGESEASPSEPIPDSLLATRPHGAVESASAPGGCKVLRERESAVTTTEGDREALSRSVVNQPSPQLLNGSASGGAVPGRGAG